MPPALPTMSRSQCAPVIENISSTELTAKRCHTKSDTKICERFALNWVQWRNASRGVCCIRRMVCAIYEYAWIAVARSPEHVAACAHRALRGHNLCSWLHGLLNGLRANV